MEKDKNSDRWLGEFIAYLGAPFTMLFGLLFHKSKHYPQLKIVGYILDGAIIAVAVYILFIRE